MTLTLIGAGTAVVMIGAAFWLVVGVAEGARR
jgi:hypothetical protein